MINNNHNQIYPRHGISNEFYFILKFDKTIMHFKINNSIINILYLLYLHFILFLFCNLYCSILYIYCYIYR